MSSRFALAVSLLAGAAIGAVAVGTLHAAGAPPAYIITEFSDVPDLAAFNEGTKKLGLPASIAASGGKVVARSDKLIALDGDLPKRFAIFSFDNADAAKGWYASAAGKALVEFRMKNSTSKSFIIEGMSP